ncbi:DNA-binding transcriptional regulator, XRE-family HTH domain [Thermoactinomyces sp. DSM 45891]|uniref:helix-turn-helix domain-containing protein n=1 Tax=Thermoactinomyces sp. DSM 45891 TaxID=1761907 RepID=UPI0009106F2C|nr:helix-turn-helix transcriptional regulator [Thermoactinomyces sp. DSM 45891]SFX82376.1 DNA-binding transcriptional regulator, XRE-family HTH domain [Thermoactinomyces sp. DSM 45891]
MDIFGQRLKELRLAHDLTQEQVGDLLKLSRKTIHGYEQQGKIPRERTSIVGIARIFNISLDYLFGVIDEPKPIKEESIDEKLAKDPYLQKIVSEIQSNKRLPEEHKLRIIEAAYASYRESYELESPSKKTQKET